MISRFTPVLSIVAFSFFVIIVFDLSTGRRSGDLLGVYSDVHFIVFLVSAPLYLIVSGLLLLKKKPKAKVHLGLAILLLSIYFLLF